MEKLNILCGASLFSKVVIRKSKLKFQFICDEDLSKSGSFLKVLKLSTIVKLKNY